MYVYFDFFDSSLLIFNYMRILIQYIRLGKIYSWEIIFLLRKLNYCRIVSSKDLELIVQRLNYEDVAK